MDADDRLTIGRLAKRLDLNPRTIRYYESIGLLPQPARTPSGYRVYAGDDEDRLRFIKRAQRIGLTLGEIKETLAFRERAESPCRYVASVIDRRLADVTRGIRELRAFKQELTELRRRMDEQGIAEGEGGYCHYIASSP